MPRFSPGRRSHPLLVAPLHTTSELPSGAPSPRPEGSDPPRGVQHLARTIANRDWVHSSWGTPFLVHLFPRPVLIGPLSCPLPPTLFLSPPGPSREGPAAVSSRGFVMPTWEKGGERGDPEDLCGMEETGNRGKRIGEILKITHEQRPLGGLRNTSQEVQLLRVSCLVRVGAARNPSDLSGVAESLNAASVYPAATRMEPPHAKRDPKVGLGRAVSPPQFSEVMGKATHLLTHSHGGDGQGGSRPPRGGDGGRHTAVSAEAGFELPSA